MDGSVVPRATKGRGRSAAFSSSVTTTRIIEVVYETSRLFAISLGLRDALRPSRAVASHNTAIYAGRLPRITGKRRSKRGGGRDRDHLI